MSNNNDSSIGRLSRFSLSNHSTTPSLSNNDESVHQAELATIIPPPNSVSATYSGSLKRPYSSVKQLDLTQFSKCDQDLNINSSSNKRLRPNNEDASFSNSFNVIDSFRRTNEPLFLQRPSSRLSISTTSSTSTTPALYKNSKFLFSSKRLSTPDGLFETKQTRDLNSSASSLYGQSSSRFYAGKTTFGGANIRKSVRRLCTTPYALSNVRTIEPSVNRQSVNSFLNQEDSQLSSVTQRILESLEKSATPIQDAKRRFSTASYQSTNFERPLVSTTKAIQSSKLFDTSFPSVKNNGRCNVDFSFKPIKYILTPASGEKEVDKVTNLDKELEKLNEIRQAEKTLELKSTESDVFQPRKDQTFGKVTRRDERKNWKGFGDNVSEDNNNNDQLDNLASVKPLTVPVTTFKPFTLSSLSETPTSEDAKDSQKETSASSSLFQFSSPAKLGPLANSNINSALNINFSSPIDTANSTLFSAQKSGAWDEKYLAKGKDWNLSSQSETAEAVENNELDGGCISKNDNSIPPNDSISLFQKLQKKQSNTWSCPTCCVDNDLPADICVSCEEPNPNKKKSDPVPANNKLSELKFGAFSAPINASANVNNSQSSLSELFKKKSNNWTCSVCMVSNDFDEPKCISCEETNPNKKNDVSTNSEIMSTFGFKFGDFSKPSTASGEISSSQKVTSKSKSIANEWTCFYCKANNKNDSQKCNECHKIKTLAATKDEVQKFCDSQTFSFGFNNPTLVATSKSNNENLSTATFKFEAPTLAKSNTSLTSKLTESSDAVSVSPFKTTTDSKISSSDIPLSNSDMFKVPSSFSLPKINSKVESASALDLNNFENEVKKVDQHKVDKNTEENKSSINLFQFGAVDTPVSAASIFKFGLSDVSNSTNAKIAPDVSTSVSTSLFTFTSKPSVTTESISTSQSTPVISIAPKLATTAESTFKLPVALTSTLPKSVFGTENIQPTPSTTATTTTTTESNRFVFGSKITTKTANTTENKPLFNFSSNVPNLNSSTVASTISTTTPNLFQFVSANTSSVPVTTKSSTLPFSFPPATTSTPSSSLFAFSTPSTTSIATTTTSSSTTTLGSKFSFGPPISLSKIDVGSPLQINSKININFPQSSSSSTTTTTTATSTASSLFSFASQNAPSTNAIGSTFGSTTSGKPEVKFNFQSNQATLNNPNTGVLFGTNSVPNFNFSANNTPSNASNSSLFSFGAKLNEPQATPFAFQAPSVVTNSTGFNFSQANQSQPSFGSNMFGASASQPVIPAFGPTALQSPQTNSAFKFNAEPSLNFQSFAANSANSADNANTGNMFQFTADPSQSTMALNRQIKKAKRRLR